MDPISLALSAVAGPLISALFGGNRDQKTTTVVRENYSFKRLRKAAEKAGFNPLTVLRATGGGIGSTTTGVSSGPSVQSQIADAVGAGAGAFFSYDPVAAASAQADLRLKQQALELGKTELGSSSWSGDPTTGSGVFNAPSVNSPTMFSDFVLGNDRYPAGGTTYSLMSNVVGDDVAGPLGAYDMFWKGYADHLRTGTRFQNPLALSVLPGALLRSVGHIVNKYGSMLPDAEMNRPKPGWMTEKFGSFHF